MRRDTQKTSEKSKVPSRLRYPLPEHASSWEVACGHCCRRNTFVIVTSEFIKSHLKPKRRKPSHSGALRRVRGVVQDYRMAIAVREETESQVVHTERHSSSRDGRL